VRGIGGKPSAQLSTSIADDRGAEQHGEPKTRPDGCGRNLLDGCESVGEPVGPRLVKGSPMPSTTPLVTLRLPDATKHPLP
jgi:hypothetical protein